MSTILQELMELADLQYKEFHSKLIPEIPKERVLGVRTPVLRKYAKEICEREDVEEFLDMLSHEFYDENNLHVELLKLKYKELNDKVTKEEYDTLIGYACDLGIENCFVQEEESQSESFIPKFKGDKLI